MSEISVAGERRTATAARTAYDATLSHYHNFIVWLIVKVMHAGSMHVCMHAYTCICDTL